MAAHAKLSPSGSSRWMACAGSIRLSAEVPEPPSSPFAAEGTAAHALAERCLREERVAAEFVGTTIEGFTVDDEMVAGVQAYVDYVQALPGKLFVETRVSMEEHVVGMFGTVDAVTTNGSDLYITDLKYGRGVRVEAEQNSQLLCYALGALAEFGWLGEIEMVHIAIVQPRLDHVSEHSIAADGVRFWAKHFLAPAAEEALKEDAGFVPGETQCRFCPAKGVCRALADHVKAIAVANFASPETLSPKEIGERMADLALIESWARAVRDTATDLLNRGTLVPGWKLVAGRSQRRWDDEDVVEKALARAKLKADQRFVKKLISPAQAEKLLGKDHPVLKHVSRADGAPTIAPETDKRPAIEINPTDGFTEIAA